MRRLIGVAIFTGMLTTAFPAGAQTFDERVLPGKDQGAACKRVNEEARKRAAELKECYRICDPGEHCKRPKGNKSTICTARIPELGQSGCGQPGYSPRGGGAPIVGEPQRPQTPKVPEPKRGITTATLTRVGNSDSAVLTIVNNTNERAITSYQVFATDQRYPTMNKERVVEEGEVVLEPKREWKREIHSWGAQDSWRHKTW